MLPFKSNAYLIPILSKELCEKFKPEAIFFTLDMSYAVCRLILLSNGCNSSVLMDISFFVILLPLSLTANSTLFSPPAYKP